MGCLSLSWWRKGFKHVGEAKGSVRRLDVQKTTKKWKVTNATHSGTCWARGNLAWEESQRGSAGLCLIMWREPLASASKGTSQSTCKGLKTGRAAAPRHSGQRASLPQPVQGDSLTLSHRRGGSPTPHSCWHRCPKIIGTEVFQRLVESLGQPYLIKWWERSW